MGIPLGSRCSWPGLPLGRPLISYPLLPSGRGHGCPISGAAVALRLLYSGRLSAAAPTTASAPATATACIPAAAAPTAPAGACRPPPGRLPDAKRQPDAGAPAAPACGHGTVLSPPVPPRECRPATDGDRHCLGKPRMGFHGAWMGGLCKKSLGPLGDPHLPCRSAVRVPGFICSHLEAPF